MISQKCQYFTILRYFKFYEKYVSTCPWIALILILNEAIKNILKYLNTHQYTRTYEIIIILHCCDDTDAYDDTIAADRNSLLNLQLNEQKTGKCACNFNPFVDVFGIELEII